MVSPIYLDHAATTPVEPGVVEAMLPYLGAADEHRFGNPSSAHAFGPGHRSAIRALRRLDRSVGQLARIVGRLPELHCDLYVCSDHGQALTRPFARVSGGRSIDEVVRDILA